MRVFCRFRPFNPTELSKDERRVVTVHKSRVVQVESEPTYREATREAKQQFEFDHVFNEEATQEEVYEVVARPLVSEIFKGYNATVFVYGQSGSGKTTTMTGYSHVVDNGELLARDDVVLWKNPKDMGVVPRMIQDIFETIKPKKGVEFSLQVSYLEIYLEKIRDLLRPSRDNLEVRESRHKGLWVEDLTEVYVGSYNETIQLIRKGELNRTVAATAMNAHSSRSHSLLIINLHQTNLKTAAKTTSRVIFVDLAGSEKVEKTKAEGLILKQAQSTNKSLLTLGLVIRALQTKAAHVPYRDSKLTRLLTDSLGGNSKTHLVVTCSPAAYNLEETISTLRFGSQTQQIKNKPRINLESNIEEYKQLLAEAQRKMEVQQRLIEELQRKTPTAEKEEPLEVVSQLEVTLSQTKLSSETLRDEVEKLRDNLEHERASAAARVAEIEIIKIQHAEMVSRNEDLTRMQTATEHYWKEQIETVKREYREYQLSQVQTAEDFVRVRTRMTQLAEENQFLKESSLRGMRIEDTTGKEERYLSLEGKYSRLLQEEESSRQLLEGKIRHLRILEESLEESKRKIQELTSAHSTKCREYDRKIKDLESQIRVLKQGTLPLGNIRTVIRGSDSREKL